MACLIPFTIPVLNVGCLRSVIRRRLQAVAVLLLLAVLAACGQRETVQQPTYTDKPPVADTRIRYVFAVHPLQNPQLLHQMYQPLINHLNAQMVGAEIVLDTSNDYADFERKLREASPQLALPNPYHAVLARDWGYHVIAKMGDDDLFRGVFIVRNDSPVRQPTDLRGKVVSYPAPTALAAAMMPQLYLQNHGIDVETEITNRYVGTHNSSIMNAYLGESAVAATWPVAWRAFQKANPSEAAWMHVIWETPMLIQNAVIAHSSVPPDVINRVQTLLTTLEASDEGRQLLAGIDTSRFVPATNQDFDVVNSFLAEFRAKVKKQP